jgi:hypothetical protein
MSARNAARWFPISMLALACLLALGTSMAAALNAGPQRLVIWILSTELLAPGLITILALTLYHLRKTTHTEA